ncbi:hypothetical protein [Evansella clarkii]|uniref:hypothetical protein n=1 Tax=Evansella clarkii TaxID=79879 RepID=UPI0009982EBD|nr:hypothetical protein [Evansella clarkii]
MRKGKVAAQGMQEALAVHEEGERLLFKGCKRFLRYMRREEIAAQGMQEALAVLENGKGYCSRDARGSCGI